MYILWTKKEIKERWKRKMINKVINIDIDYDAMGVEKSPRQTTLTTYIIDKEILK